MFVVALTGGIGSGKSLVANLFSELGVAIIDTDVIARELVKPDMPALENIKQHFGSTIINAKQELERAALRKIIFSNPAEKKWLENLLHPLITANVEHQLKTISSPYCIVVIPLLFETHISDYINRVLVVEAPLDIRVERVRQRDKISKTEIEKIIHSQASDAVRREGADDIIENNGTMDDVAQQVKKLHGLYLTLA